jgi:hypothetical protein
MPNDRAVTDKVDAAARELKAAFEAYMDVPGVAASSVAEILKEYAEIERESLQEEFDTLSEKVQNSASGEKLSARIAAWDVAAAAADTLITALQAAEGP